VLKETRSKHDILDPAETAKLDPKVTCQMAKTPQNTIPAHFLPSPISSICWILCRGCRQMKTWTGEEIC
jgi:hypothetical protein